MAGLLWYRSYMDSLANTNGYYPDIHAGHADRVAAKLTLDAPYLVRETPAGYNQLELMELVGGTVAWNQLCNSSSVTGASGHKFYLKQSGAESITNINTFTGLASGTDMVTDLTQMLGPTIADYVYSLEQATAGSGIAWLKSYGFFTEDYISYSAPTMQSVEATSHVTKDANNTTIATYPLDSNLVLRGIPKLSNGNLYYDGDTYEWDGTVNRRFAEVDFGDLEWSYISQQGFFSASLTDKKPGLGNAIVQDYAFGGWWSSWSNKNMVWCGNINNIGFNVKNTAYTDKDTFKSAMRGKKLIYELADEYQTTESADPFTAVQTVEDGGTEEFATTNNIPVGNVSIYRRV